MTVLDTLPTARAAARPAARRKRLKLSWTFMIGAAILAVSLLLAFVPGVFSPYDPTHFDYRTILKGP